MKPHDKLQSDNNAYVYLHIDIATDDVFYVGISNNNDGGKYNRANRIHSRSRFWNNYTKLNGFKIEIYKDNISWKEACKLENELIIKFGRRDIKTGNLVNLTNGGEGFIGHSKEMKKSLSIGTKKSWADGKMDILLKKIYKYSDNGELVSSFNSIKEAEKETKICRTEISACVNNKRLRAGGYFWSFENSGVKVPELKPRGWSGKVGIVGYDIITEKVYTFASEKEAEIYFKISGLSTSICKCIHGETERANDIIWYNSEHDSNLALIKRASIRGERMIVRIDKLNNIEIFNNLKDACFLTNGIDFRNVSACTFGKQKTAYGYKWKKLKDYERA